MNRLSRDLAPIRAGENRRDHVGEEDAAHGEKHALDLAVGATRYHEPEKKRDAGNEQVAKSAPPKGKQLDRRRDSRKLADGRRKVGDEENDHRKDRHAHSELLADQVGEALARDHAHARAHLLRDDQGEGREQEKPQHRVAELRPDGGVGDDAARFVAGGGGDQPRPENGEEDEQARTPRTARRRSFRWHGGGSFCMGVGLPENIETPGRLVTLPALRFYHGRSYSARRRAEGFFRRASRKKSPPIA